MLNRRSVSSLLWLAFLFPAAAPAQTPDDSRLLDAIAVFDSGDFARADSLFGLLSSAELSDTDRAIRHLYLGLIDLAYGERVEALGEFEEVVRLSAAVRPDPATYSPSRIAAFQDAKAAVLEAAEQRALELERQDSVEAAVATWRWIEERDPAYPELAARVAALDARLAASEEATAAPPAAPPARRERPAEERVDPPPAGGGDSGSALGFFVPGGSYFATGRPVPGVLALGAAGGALALGVLSVKEDVRCRVPATSSCPSDQVAGSSSERPYLLVGLGAAAAVTVLGALHANRGDGGGRDAGRDGGAAAAGLRLQAPALASSGGGVRIEWLRLRF